MIWQHKLAGLIEALNRPEFAALFLKTMRSVADFDSSVIMAYGVGPRPEILHDELSREFRNAFYERYLSQAAFVLSPLYQTFRAGKQGFFHVNTLAPDGFFESRYYKAYYRYSGLLDQVFYLSRLRNDLAVVVSMARTRKFNDFDRSVIGDFKSIEPIALSLLSKHWEHLGSGEPSFTDYLYTAFQQFGSSKLTRREKDVVDHILRGCSSKSAASIIGITPETERSYRKIVYRKLKVGSHAELYNLFFRALEFADIAGERDPLELLRESDRQNVAVG
ncbi:MAG: helix-turn-helix transcriptional regulator [Rhodospirillaceae bacterium]|nr:helix-turn-helix transcriptional regulator [Rhodospirillaceae bacterium]